MIHMPWVFVYSARATAVTVTVRLVRIPPGMYMPLLLWEQAIHIHTHACILYISVWILTGEGTCFRDNEKLTLSGKLCNGYRRRGSPEAPCPSPVPLQPLVFYNLSWGTLPWHSISLLWFFSTSPHIFHHASHFSWAFSSSFHPLPVLGITNLCSFLSLAESCPFPMTQF